VFVVFVVFVLSDSIPISDVVFAEHYIFADQFPGRNRGLVRPQERPFQGISR